MIGRRTAVGLSLLCALVLCAVAAPSAVALKGTTAFTCKPEPKPTSETKGFTDEHCTKEAGGAFVSFIHQEIELVFPTFVSVANTETKGVTVPAKLKTTVEGMEFEAEAEAFQSCENKTWLANLVNGAGQMFSGGKYCGEFTKVTVNKPANCQVLNGAVKTEELGFWTTEVVLNKNKEEEMWVEFRPPVPEKPEEKTRFATFEITGAKCVLKGKKVELTGAAKANVTTKATPLDGATLKFTTTRTGETLKAGAEKAEFQGTFTPRMSEETVGEELNPIVLTTTEK